ncbi:MAG: hypothetical protein IPL89_10480 [Acidobacteria bacterium]|nr:hypothetical protein [Acidobacteriota bacterium]
MTSDERPVSRTAKLISILLALLAPARMAWIVFTVGENNLSNDYVGRVDTVAAILEGRYGFTHLFRDTFNAAGHSWLGLLSVFLFDARVFAWDMRVELGIGLLFAAVKVLLLWLAAAPGLSRRARWVLLPVLSTLAFSVTQVSSFTFGESSLQMQLAQVGLALGVFAIARLGDRPDRRAALVAAGGLIASWSWGGGVMVWPVLAAGLWAAGERSIVRWTALGAAAATGLSQYFLILETLHHPARATPPGFHDPRRFVDILGRPFGNDLATRLSPLPSCLAFGAAALVLLAVAVLHSRGRMRERLAGLLVAGWGLLAALQIGYLRPEAAPWYVVPMTAFWMGLAVLVVASRGALRVAGLTAIGAGLVFSNRTWEDKSFYLVSRAPVSAACMREWRTAPASCRGRLFQWGSPDVGEVRLLCEPLERLGLSAFGPRRTQLLQGDTILGRVDGLGGAGRAFLSRDGRKAGDPNDYRRLDLVLASGAAVTWRVDLPPDLELARFETLVRADAADPSIARGARVAIAGGAGEARVLVPRGDAEPLALDLKAYAGRTVTLRIEADDVPGTAPLVLARPRVEIEIPRDAQRRRAS